MNVFTNPSASLNVVRVVSKPKLRPQNPRIQNESDAQVCMIEKLMTENQSLRKAVHQLILENAQSLQNAAVQICLLQEQLGQAEQNLSKSQKENLSLREQLIKKGELTKYALPARLSTQQGSSAIKHSRPLLRSHDQSKLSDSNKNNFEAADLIDTASRQNWMERAKQGSDKQRRQREAEDSIKESERQIDRNLESTSSKIIASDLLMTYKQKVSELLGKNNDYEEKIALMAMELTRMAMVSQEKFSKGHEDTFKQVQSLESTLNDLKTKYQDLLQRATSRSEDPDRPVNSARSNDSSWKVLAQLD